jgi:L-threonylcarbamoyladenylate synthase
VLTSIAFDIPDTARKLIDRMWPGALTLVFKLNPEFKTLAAAGGNTIAVRIPNHDMTLKILAETGVPLSGTSANLASGENPITADDVYGQIGDSVDIIVDGGPCPGTVASTVIDVSQGRPKVVRYGAVPKEDIEEACGIDVE